jgi:hypothetical protein
MFKKRSMRDVKYESPGFFCDPRVLCGEFISMTAQERLSITDSPWFWVLAFSMMSLLAVAVLSFSGKYDRRQSVDEVKYQARERVAEKLAAENNSQQAQRIDDPEARRPFATPGNKLIPLWPLAVLLAVVAMVAAAMLYRARLHLVPRPDESLQP